MPEEISTFFSFEGAGNQADSATKSFDCALSGLAQLRFDFAEALFDWIEIGRILRQISQARADRFDCLRDDECRVRTDNAPANFATCRHIAYNLTRKAPGKDSIRLRRKTAGWDDEYLASLIAA